VAEEYNTVVLAHNGERPSPVYDQSIDQSIKIPISHFSDSGDLYDLL